METGTRFDQRDGLPGVAIDALHTDAHTTLWAAGDGIEAVVPMQAASGAGSS